MAILKPDWMPDEEWQPVAEAMREFMGVTPEDAEGMSQMLGSVFCAGEWLGNRLEEAGFDAEKAGAICEAAGQRMLGASRWDVARSVLERARSGDTDSPGADLAVSLLQGTA